MRILYVHSGVSSDYCDKCKRHWLETYGNSKVTGGWGMRGPRDHGYRCGACREKTWALKRRV